MIFRVNSAGDIKPYIKQGFFDSKQIEKLFSTDRAKISQALNPDKQGHTLVNLLTEIFNEKIEKKEGQSIDEIFQYIEKSSQKKSAFEDGELE